MFSTARTHQARQSRLSCVLIYASPFLFRCSVGPAPEIKPKDPVKTINGKGGDMVSRRKILSRSRDDLSSDVFVQQQEEEDVWYQKEKLFRVSRKSKVDAPCRRRWNKNEFSLRNENKERIDIAKAELIRRKK